MSLLDSKNNNSGLREGQSVTEMSEMGNARDFTLETRSQYLESKTPTILESKPELQNDAYSQSSKQMPA